jgi:hypothetical protein
MLDSLHIFAPRTKNKISYDSKKKDIDSLIPDNNSIIGIWSMDSVGKQNKQPKQLQQNW